MTTWDQLTDDQQWRAIADAHSAVRNVGQFIAIGETEALENLPSARARVATRVAVYELLVASARPKARAKWLRFPGPLNYGLRSCAWFRTARGKYAEHAADIVVATWYAGDDRSVAALVQLDLTEIGAVLVLGEPMRVVDGVTHAPVTRKAGS